MKSEHRHELKTNELAEWLGNLPKWTSENLTTILVVLVVVVVGITILFLRSYNKNVVHSGPLYDSMNVEGDKIRISFDHVADGLMSKDGEKLTGFALAGADRKFYWADAEIVGQEVIVKSTQVPEPVAVRYGWAANPVCNLYNSAGLPASPFRSDDWPGLTQNKN